MVSGRKSVKKTTAGTARKRTATTVAAKQTPGQTVTQGTAAAAADKRAPGKNTHETKPEPITTPPGVIDLGAVLVVSNVLEWQQKISPTFDAADTLTLDGAKIEQIDGAGLQLLVAMIKEAGRRGMSVVWTGASPTLRAGAAQLGLADTLCFEASTG